MPFLRGGDWVYEQGEVPPAFKENDTKAENRSGHRPLGSYNLPKWVYHPDKPIRRIVVNREDYFGMASDGLRNSENWNVAHVAAFHDDLKLLSLATLEQCKEPNRWGMTPAHMTGLGQHPYGPSLAVLYELVQLGVADPEALNHAEQTPWHVCQRMHKPSNLKKFEKVLLKGHKPEHYDQSKEAQLRPRGKFARAVGLDVAVPEDLSRLLPCCITFPGQGSQYVGMLSAVQDSEPVKALLAKAQPILGYDILDIMLNGPADKLAQTQFCQPAMYIAGLAALEQLKMEEPSKISRCTAMCGLSLGEYTALTAAGALDFETGLRIVKARAEAMDFETTRPGAKKQGTAFVAGLDRETLDKLCKETAGRGEVCQIADHLFPRGFSVAGTEAAIVPLCKKATDAGALQAKPLQTNGAFHTSLMAGAKDHVAGQLAALRSSIKSPRCQVYMNTTGTAIGPNTPVSDIIRMLSDQVTTPVLWQQSMEQAIKDGCTDFYECGPGKQLKAMMKRIDPKVADKMQNVLV